MNINNQPDLNKTLSETGVSSLGQVIVELQKIEHDLDPIYVKGFNQAIFSIITGEINQLSQVGQYLVACTGVVFRQKTVGSSQRNRTYLKYFNLLADHVALNHEDTSDDLNYLGNTDVEQYKHVWRLLGHSKFLSASVEVNDRLYYPVKSLPIILKKAIIYPLIDKAVFAELKRLQLQVYVGEDFDLYLADYAEEVVRNCKPDWLVEDKLSPNRETNQPRYRIAENQHLQFLTGLN